LLNATYRVRSRNGNPPRTAVGISGDGSNGSAPFTSLVSQLNPQNNTISATITQPGFLCIGQRDLPDPIFDDRFEAPPP
jgi:hypothetical protein